MSTTKIMTVNISNNVKALWLTLWLSQKLAVANPAAVSKRSSGVTSIMNGSVGTEPLWKLPVGAYRPAHNRRRLCFVAVAQGRIHDLLGGVQISETPEASRWTGRGDPCPADLEVWEASYATPAGSGLVWPQLQTILGRFRCNFMRLHASFSASECCPELRDSYTSHYRLSERAL